MFPSCPSALPAPSVAQTGEEWMRRASARHLERLAGVNDVTIVQVMEGGVETRLHEGSMVEHPGRRASPGAKMDAPSVRLLRARRTRFLRWYWSRSRPTAMVIGS